MSQLRKLPKTPIGSTEMIDPGVLKIKVHDAQSVSPAFLSAVEEIVDYIVSHERTIESLKSRVTSLEAT